MNTMTCDNCKRNNTYIKEYEHTFIIKGKEIRFNSKRRFCKDCNCLVYDSKLDNEASELAISIYNEKYGISKDDIIKLRQQYNLSQDLFSKIIGCAKKTLISYEKGKSIPNDSYMIIIKSLIAKPETILVILDANKEQFTNKEYERINKKLANVLPYDAKNIIVHYSDDLNEYNGYTKFSKEKLYNMICFFSEKSVLKTKLLKEMFYADFESYKELGKSITGLEYTKLPYGPVPEQFEYILNLGIAENTIDYNVTYKSDYESHNITANKKIDKDIFTKEEYQIIKNIRNKFKDYGSKEIVDYSHKEKAFKNTKYYDKISYDYAFDIELD